MTQNKTPTNLLANLLDSKLLRQFTIPFLSLITGVFALSSNSIFLKFALQELNIESIFFDTLLISTIAFASWNLGSKLWQIRLTANTNTITEQEEEKNPTETIRPKNWIVVGLIFLVAITNLTAGFLFVWSLDITRAVNAVILSNLTPIFAFLGAWLFIGKQFDRRFLIGLIIAMVGSICLASEDWLNIENQELGAMAILGDGAALLSAIVYAFALLLTEKVLKYISNITFLTWVPAINLIFIATLVCIKGYSVIPTNMTGWLAIFGSALVAGIISRSLITYTFRYFSAAFITIVKLLEPLPVAFFAWILFSEAVSIFNITGFILIFIGIYLAKTGKGAESN